MNDWSVIRTKSLTHALLVSLLKNEIAAICIPEFTSNLACKQLVQRIYAHGIDYYKDKHPRVGKIGITQSEHKYNSAQKDEYLAKVLEAYRVQQSIFADGSNLLRDVIGVTKDAWGGQADIAYEENLQRPYFAGLVRVINKAQLHYDWSPLYSLGWKTDKIAAQLTWNIYLQVGASGGATRVYRQFGQKSDLKNHLLPEGYFAKKVVEGAEHIEIMPEQGELVFFNSQNYHEVEQTEGEDERITFSSFIGLFEAENALAFWS